MFITSDNIEPFDSDKLYLNLGVDHCLLDTTHHTDTRKRRDHSNWICKSLESKPGKPPPTRLVDVRPMAAPARAREQTERERALAQQAVLQTPSRYPGVLPPRTLSPGFPPHPATLCVRGR